MSEISVFSSHIKEVIALLFTLDNDKLISSSKDKTIKFWDLKTY